MTDVVSYTYSSAEISFGDVFVGWDRGSPVASMNWTGGTHVFTATRTIPRRRWRRLRRAVYGVPGPPVRLGPWWVRQLSLPSDTRSS